MKPTSGLAALTLILASGMFASAHAGVVGYQQAASSAAGTAAGSAGSKIGGGLFPSAPVPAPVPLPALILPPPLLPVGAPPVLSQVPLPVPAQGTALPEPQSAALMVGGLALLGAMTRRRKAARRG